VPTQPVPIPAGRPSGPRLYDVDEETLSSSSSPSQDIFEVRNILPLLPPDFVKIPEILVPPRSVLPPKPSLALRPKDPFMVMTDRPGDGVGLLRRLSLYSSCLQDIYYPLRERMHGDWDVVLNKLFGTLVGDDFVGYGTRDVPGHDRLGLFPMFMDGLGREFFEVTTIYKPGTLLEFTMRIPRHLTRRQHAEAFKYAMTPPDQELRFPEVNEVLTLKPCGVPIFPFLWRANGTDIVNILHTDSNWKYVRRFQNVAQLEYQKKIYERSTHVRVVQVAFCREATCLVQIEPIDPKEFHSLFLPIQIQREEFFTAIVELFKNLDPHKGTYNAESVANFCNYMQGPWMDAAVEWVRNKQRNFRTPPSSL
jgi:hypothetical protein